MRTLLLLSLLAACGGQTGELQGSKHLDCEATTTVVDAAETTDLGFSAAELAGTLGDTPAFALTYEAATLGYTTDTATLTRTGEVDAARVTRAGDDCGELYADLDVVQVRWPVAIATTSGDVQGDGTMAIEAPALDRVTFSALAQGGDATFSATVWDAFFVAFPEHEHDVCVGGVSWSGTPDAGEWRLTAECDEDDDGSPEFSGGWLDAAMALDGGE